MPIFIGGSTGLTWAAARDKVRGDLWRPGNSLSDDVVNRALHASVLELEAECNWLWLEQVAGLATIDEPAPYLDLPLAIGRVHSVSLRQNGWLEQLRQLTLPPVREAAESASGEPTWWALADQRIYFDCSVPAGTELELIFQVATPDDLDDAVASNCATLQRQQQAVIANACSMVALSFMKNEDEARRQRALYERLLERLFNIEADKRGGGVQPDTWGMGCG